jgi:uncharacterized protein (TIGR03546 family)
MSLLAEGGLMLSLVLRPVRQLIDALTANDSPNQLAVGFTIGMMLGLVPKGNLIAVALMVLLCAVRVNRSAGLLSAAMFSLVAPLLDGITHKIGEAVLYQPGLQGAYAWLYDQPLGPFIGFHNTVTIGALLLGLYITYPCFYGSRMVFVRFGPQVASFVEKYRVGRKIKGAQLAARWGE